MKISKLVFRGLNAIISSWLVLTLIVPIHMLGWVTSAQASNSLRVTEVLPLNVPRQGHTATVLPDGRILVIGGENASGPVAAIEIFDPASTAFVLAGNLGTARVGHKATLLDDGRVLITGGHNTSGPLNSAEIYDPASQISQVTASMSAARNQHSATKLIDGQVLLAGGDEIGTAELFDPVTGTFTPVGLLQQPRTAHSATLFADNSVFFAGGGANTAEFFDLTNQTFTLVPQPMTTPRTDPTAIATADAKLLLVGGDSSNTVERFDPVTETFAAIATLPATESSATLLANEKILVLGQSMAGVLSADSGNSWTALTGTNAVSLQRTGQTATELPGNKQILVVGGRNSSNELVGAATLYNPVVIATDEDDYPPFSFVDITGSGFLPGETVSNQVTQIEGPAAGAAYDAWTTIADANGGYSTSWLVFTEDLAYTTLELTAKGLTSGLAAQTRFTDAPNPSISSFSPTSKVVGEGAFTLTINGANFASGITGTFNGTSRTVSFVSGSQVTMSVAAADLTTAGSFAVVVKNTDNKTGSSNYPVNPASTTTVVGSSANPSTYGNSVTFTATVSVTAPGSGTPTGTVTFKDGAATLGTGTLSSGTATFATSALSASGSPHSITAVYNGDSNFNTSTSSALSQTVNKAALTITANAQNKTYGTSQSTPVSGSSAFTSSGLQNSETIGSVTLTYGAGGLTASSAAGATSTITPSAATGGTFNAANYTINYVAGTLTVVKAALTITASAQSKTYGATLSLGTSAFTSSGLQNSETIGSVTLTASGGTAATDAAGAYTITPSAATGGTFTASNYTISYATGTLTVNKAALTITASNQSKTYGQTLTFAGTEFTTSALQNGETVGSVTLTSSGAASTAAAGSFSIVPSAATGGTFAASNYTISYVNGTLTVNPLVVSLTGSRSYDGTTAAAAGILTVANKVGSDNIAVASGSATLASKNLGTQAISSLGTLALGGTAAGNYTLTGASGSVTIGSAALTITASAQSKTYGSTLSLGTTAFTTSGLNAGDSVTSVTLSSNGGTAATDAAGNYTITPSAAVGTGLGNYTITYATGTLTVNKAALTITASAQSKTYGTTLSLGTSAFTSSGLQNSETIGSVTLTASGGTAVTDAAGTYTITPSAATGGTFTASNYTITYTTGTLTVNKAALTVTATGPSKTYGTALTTGSSTVNFSSTGLLNSDSITSVTLTPNTAGSTATTAAGGAYVVTPSAAVGTGLSNYTISYVAYNGTVTKKALTVTATGPSKNYGTALTAGTSSVNFSHTGEIAGETVTSVTLTPDAAGLSAATAAGAAYVVTPSLATGTGGFLESNYQVTYNVFNGTVSKVALSITASAQSKTYGTALTLGTSAFTSSGLQNGETIGAVTLTASGSPAGDLATAAAGSYTLTPSAAIGGTFNVNNYTITYNTGTLTVNKATLTITANNDSKTYGQTKSYGAGSTAFTSSALQNGETVGSVTLSSSGAAATAAVSTYAITPSAATGGTFNVNNYTITYNTGTLTVNKAALSITANDRSKTYGATLALGTSAFTSTGLQNSETIGSVTLSSSGAAATAVVATYPVTPSAAAGGTFSAGNYTITYNDGTLTVNKATLNVSADNKSMGYGGSVPALTASYSGFANGETSSVLSGAPALSTTGTSGSPAGTYPITAALGTLSAANYTFTFTSGTLTINAAGSTTTLTSSDTMPVYGAAVTLTATVTTGGGMPTGTVTFYRSNGSSSPIGTATLNGSGVATLIVSTLAVGSYPKFHATYSGDSNYPSGNSNDLRHDVSAAPLTITANNDSKTYGQTKSYGAGSTAFTSSALQNGETIGTVTLASSGAAATAAAGSYTIVPSAATGGTFSPGNYSITYVNGTLTVSKSTLTVTADNSSRAYGAANPTFTASYSGFLNSDTPSVLSGSPSLTTSATAASPVGSYTISAAAGTLSAANYNFTYATGTLTVTKAILTGNITATDKVYDGTIAATLTSRTLTGVIGSDAVTLATSAAAFDSKDVGTGKTVTATGLSLTGADAGNYQLAATTATTTADITSVELTITASNKSKGYGTANPALTATYAGFITGETAAVLTTPVTLSTTATTGSGVGTYPITASGAVAANYTISYVSGTLTVNQGTVTITADNQTRIYGAADPTFTASYSGFVNGETLATSGVTGSPSLTTTATASSPVAGSPYAIAAGIGSLSAANYSFNFVNGLLTITKADTTTSLGSSANPSLSGNPVALTATVSAVAPGSGTPSGTVTFLDGASTLGTATLSGGQATLNTAALALGSHTISAVYNGDGNFNSSTSADMTQVVNSAPVVTTQPVSQLVPAGSPVTFTSAAAANPGASVQWEVSANGGASYTPITGATSSTLMLTPSTADNGKKFRAKFTNPLGSTPSNPADLTVPAVTLSAPVITVTRTGYSFNNTTQRYVQTVTIKNNGTAVIQGVISMALDSLSSNATVYQSTGDTSATTPVGSRYVNFPATSLNPGATTSLVVQFVNPTKAVFTYTPRVLAGPGAR